LQTDVVNKELYIFLLAVITLLYYNYRRNNHWNQYTWMSQVHVAKATAKWTTLLASVAVRGLYYFNMAR